jgi:hypothetical protein
MFADELHPTKRLPALFAQFVEQQIARSGLGHWAWENGDSSTESSGSRTFRPTSSCYRIEQRVIFSWFSGMPGHAVTDDDEGCDAGWL